MISLSVLIWKSFFRRVLEPTLTFTLPILIYLILRFAVPFGDSSDFFKVNYLVAGIILYIFMNLGLLALPAQIMSFRESVIVKRIGVTPFNPNLITFTFIINYIILGILGSIFFVLIAVIIDIQILTKSSNDVLKEITLTSSGISTTMDNFVDGLKTAGGDITNSNLVTGVKNTVLNNVFSDLGTFSSSGFLMKGENIGSFIGVFSLMAAMSLSAGMVISSISKSSAMAFAIGSMVFFPSMFLTGMYFPFPVNEIAGKVAWLTPWRSASLLIYMSWFGGVFASNTGSLAFDGMADSFLGLNTNIGKNNETWIALAVVCCFTIICGVFAFFKFKWQRVK